MWLTAESLGDADPALAAHPGLPAVFVFDEPLLRRLALSGKRLVFLAETLADLATRREVAVLRRPAGPGAGRPAARRHVHPGAGVAGARRRARGRGAPPVALARATTRRADGLLQRLAQAAAAPGGERK